MGGMKKTPLELFKDHAARWGSCDKCALSKTRNKIVLARGVVPCDLMVVGEAPGSSEDVFGLPFQGPAGHLLDDILEEAFEGRKVRVLMTNLVACIPYGEDGRKADPSDESIDMCQDRLSELIVIARPRAIAWAGKVAAGNKPGAAHGIPFVEIVHPSWIIRADVSQRGLAIQRSVVEIRDLLEEVMG